MKRLASFSFTIILGLVTAAAGADKTTSTPPIRVAIYDDAGGNAAGPTNVEKCLAAQPGFTTKRVNAADIRKGILKDFDVVVHPGGSGSKQAAALGEEGREIERKFIEGGGGYLGICAGAYLASADYSWSLHVLDAKVIDRAHWARGNGDVKMKLAPCGRDLLGGSDEVVTIRYAQGPLLGPAADPKIPDFESLAIFETEIRLDKRAPEGIMIGTTAAARGEFGRGHVFCFSPHPERSPGLESYIPTAVRWAAVK